MKLPRDQWPSGALESETDADPATPWTIGADGAASRVGSRTTK